MRCGATIEVRGQQEEERWGLITEENIESEARWRENTETWVEKGTEDLSYNKSWTQTSTREKTEKVRKKCMNREEEPNKIKSYCVNNQTTDTLPVWHKRSKTKQSESLHTVSNLLIPSVSSLCCWKESPEPSPLPRLGQTRLGKYNSFKIYTHTHNPERAGLTPEHNTNQLFLCSCPFHQSIATTMTEINNKKNLLATVIQILHNRLEAQDKKPGFLASRCYEFVSAWPSGLAVSHMTCWPRMSGISVVTATKSLNNTPVGLTLNLDHGFSG